METMDSEKCLVCEKDCDGVACELCEAVPYCSDECEAADFMSHRESCRFRERTLQLQRTCVACDIEFDEDSKTTINARPAEICTLCFGAKYCSVECKDANAEEHKLLCKDYANLPLRPNADDRLHLLFPEDEDKPRFIWLSDVDSVKELVSPEFGKIDRGSFFSQIPKDFFKQENPGDYRNVKSSYTRAFAHVSYVSPNRSLGMPIIGRELSSMKGKLLLSGKICVEGDREDGDVIPGDLAKLLAYFQEAEIDHENSHNKSSLCPQSAIQY